MCPHAARTWSALHSSGTTNSWWHRLLFLPWLSYCCHGQMGHAMIYAMRIHASMWQHTNTLPKQLEPLQAHLGKRPQALPDKPRGPTNPGLLVVSPKKQTTETTLGSKSGSKLSDDVKVIGSMPYRESNSYKSYVLYKR